MVYIFFVRTLQITVTNFETKKEKVFKEKREP